MYEGINAGFGARIGNELPMLHQFGVQMVRQDFTLCTIDPAILISEFANTPIKPLWLVDKLEHLPMLPAGSWVELMNEPDLKMTPEHYAEFVDKAHALTEALDLDLRLFTGSISNLAQRPLTWLNTLLKLCPYVLDIAVHRYPEGVSFDEPHAGFHSRADEVDVLLDVIGDRPFIVSEFGYHMAKRGWWIFSRRLSGLDQRKRIEAEFRFWRQQGAEAALVYQLNDGQEDKPIARYGIRDVHGVWKLSALSFGRS